MTSYHLARNNGETVVVQLYYASSHWSATPANTLHVECYGTRHGEAWHLEGALVQGPGVPTARQGAAVIRALAQALREKVGNNITGLSADRVEFGEL